MEDRPITPHLAHPGLALANGHKRHQTSVGLSLPIPLRVHHARTGTKTKFLAQVTEP